MNITNDIIREVIDSNDIYIEFQPVYSLNTKKIIGLEALARGKYKGEIISPYFLFDYGKRNGSLKKIDSLCREKAMSAFSDGNTAPDLFINFETSILNEAGHIKYTDDIFKTTLNYGLNPENVVIELNESKVGDIYDLLMFIDFYRSRNFLIALDNVGSSPDILNKIMLINPDIIKIDRMIVSNIELNNYNQEIFKSIIQVAKRIGAMTVAEGTESADEVIACMLFGVDYFQGFFFSEPGQFNYLFTNEARLKLEDAAVKLNMSIKNNPTVINIQIEAYKNLINDIINKLSGIRLSECESILMQYITEHIEIESIFLIDEKGFQISDTIMSASSEIEKGFHPAVYGERHDIKNYFYAVKEKIEDPFISGWYISSATGKLCKTISSHFRTDDNKFIVVCIDLKKRLSAEG